jgi:hypothetical protein
MLPLLVNIFPSLCKRRAKKNMMLCIAMYMIISKLLVHYYLCFPSYTTLQQSKLSN